MSVVTRIDLRDAVCIKSLYAPENALLERIGVRSLEKSRLQPTKPIALRLLMQLASRYLSRRIRIENRIFGVIGVAPADIATEIESSTSTTPSNTQDAVGMAGRN